MHGHMNLKKFTTKKQFRTGFEAPDFKFNI
jgi:hypothetical protein